MPFFQCIVKKLLVLFKIKSIVQRYITLVSWPCLVKLKDLCLCKFTLIICTVQAHMSTPVDELPSLSLASPWTPSNKGFPRGRGRGKVRYLQLESENLDEVPLINEGVEEGEGEGEMEKPAWNGRQKWRYRLKSQSTFISWICDGGWQLLLKK